MAKRKRKPKYVYLVSLGCAKNLVDTEHMLAVMQQLGLELAATPEEADVLLLNTCAFTEEARAETTDVLRELLRYANRPHKPAVVVTGCMATRCEDRLRRDFPAIDAVVPLESYEQLPRILAEVAWRKREQPAELPAYGHGRVLSTLPHTAYLRIAEGCDLRCAFCAIPLIRGAYVSVPFDDLVQEAAALVDGGVRELSLIAEDIMLYGKDLYDRRRLVELLRELDALPGLDWLRLLYAYPNQMDRELLDTVAAARTICPYVDMPTQHGDNAILAAMRRGITRERLLELVTRWRETVPGVVLRTSVIVGFPGETDAAFANLLDFLREARFDRVAVFRFSREPGTPAYDLPGQLDEDTKQQRIDEAVALCEAQAATANQALVGQQLDVLIDAPSPVFPDFTQGRWYGQAPDVDGCTLVEGEHEPGTFVTAEVFDCKDYDLFARPVKESAS